VARVKRQPTRGITRCSRQDLLGMRASRRQASSAGAVVLFAQAARPAAAGSRCAGGRQVAAGPGRPSRSTAVVAGSRQAPGVCRHRVRHNGRRQRGSICRHRRPVRGKIPG